MRDVLSKRVSKRIESQGLVYVSHTEPLSEAELASLAIEKAIERNEPMSINIAKLQERKADRKIGAGRGKSGTTVSFKFNVSDLFESEVLEYLRSNTIDLRSDDPEMGWQIEYPTDDSEPLKNPGNKVASTLVEAFESEGFKLSVRVSEDQQTVSIMNRGPIPEESTEDETETEDESTEPTTN